MRHSSFRSVEPEEIYQNSESNASDLQSYARQEPVEALSDNDEVLENPDVNYSSYVDTEISDILKENVTGMALLELYCKRKELSSADRTHLVDIIVRHEIRNNPGYKMRTERLIKLASLIEKTFPGESSSTYFIPYGTNKITGQKFLAKGKLYDKYNHIRKYLRESGLLKESRNRGQQRTITKPVILGTRAQLQSLGSGPNSSKDCEENILWLRNHVEPWDKVKQFWGSTSRYRIEEMIDSETPLYNYLAQFPALQESSGYDLIDIDFSLHHPLQQSMLFNEWSSFQDEVFQYCIKRKSQDSSVKSLLDVIENRGIPVTAETKAIVVLRLLPLLLPNPTVKGSKKPAWRPSKAETQDSFLLHAKNEEDLELLLQKRNEQMEVYGLPDSPLPIVIGPSFDKIQCYFVCIKHVKYSVKSVLHAMDISFKSFYALQQEFPRESKFPWLVLQNRVYHVAGETDQVLPAIMTFTADLKRKNC